MDGTNKYFVIYKITNKINSRFYIGMHITENPNDGYLGSGKRIKAEVKKYGKENFVKEILEYLPDRIALANREKEIVNEELLQNPLCLNLKNGGEGGGGFWSKEQAKNFHRAGWSAMQSAKSFQTMSNAAKKADITRKYKVEHQYYSKERIAQWQISAKLGAIKAAKNIEGRVKRKVTMKERGHMQGEKNSQFGIKRVGINKEGKLKKVLPEHLQSYLDKGWTVSKKTSEVLSKREIEYNNFLHLDLKCKNFQCDNKLSFLQFKKSIKCCSKSCSNRIRYSN